MATTTPVLTERQQEVKTLMEQGMKAPAIAKKLKISENGVYQHQRKIRAALGGKSAPKSGAKAKAAPKPKAAPKAAPKPAPTPAPVKPPTMLQLAKDEVKQVDALVREEEQAIAAAERTIEQSKARIAKLQEERGRKADVLAVLQGEKRAVAIPAKKPAEQPAETPAAPKPAASRPRTSGAKVAGAKAGATNGGEKAASGAEAATSGAAATPTPDGQREREATADDIDRSEADAAQAASEAPTA